MLPLIITLFSGLSFLVGYIIVKNVKNKEKFVIFSISLALPIMIGLILLDLVPELFETFSMFDFQYRLLIILGLIFSGVFLLKALDLLIPHHEHNHDKHDVKDHKSHLYHIGFVTTIALILHNFIEGIAIYTTALNDTKAGVLMSLAVFMHNVPLGMSTVSSFYVLNKNIWYMLISLVLSTVLGAIIINLSGLVISSVLLGGMIGITTGMIIYISFLELLPEIICHRGNKESIYGLFAGIVVLLMIIFI